MLDKFNSEENLKVEELKMAQDENICRLCLNTTDSTSNIFEDGENKAIDEKNEPLSTVINELFQICYENSPLLPSSICQRCLFMVKSFQYFKKVLTKCDTDLQSYVKKLHESKNKDSTFDLTSALHDDSDIYEADANCSITEIDPNEDFETSEDEFSMESESDADLDTNMAIVPTSVALQENQKPIDMVPHKSTGANQVEINLSFARDSLSNATEFPSKNTFLCQFCDMAFKTPAECTNHEQQHDAVNPYACAFCTMQTSIRPNLIYHIRETHDAERPFICALCKKGFCRRSDLKKHTIVHTGVRPFTCPSCSKSFSRNTNLTKHMRIHTGERPHVCQLCPRSFTTAAELHTHTRTHTEVKPFRCSQCPSSFTRRDKLVLHERSHIRRAGDFQTNQSVLSGSNAKGISPVFNQTQQIVTPMNAFGAYANDELAQTETYGNSILAAQLQQSHVQSNINLPTQQGPIPSARQGNVKTFKCEICSMTFNRERDLQRHNALHLDTLFTCKQCGMVFNRREKLMRHENETHSLQYPCNVCGVAFNKLNDLDQHRKMHDVQQNVSINVPQTAFGGGFDPSTTIQTPTTDLSFYSNLTPTMNLGFYSETKSEDRGFSK